MAKMTKAEVRKRALKRDAANVDPGYGAAFGQAFRESGADLGEGLVGRGAGYLNTLQKLFTGVDKVGLRAAQDKGTAANQRVFEDVEAAGGGKAAWAYTIAREMGIGAAEYAALGGLGKGISALSKLRKGASAAEAAAAAAKAGVPPQVAKGLWGLIKRHKVASAIVGAGLVGGGIMGARSIAEEEKSQTDDTPRTGLQGGGEFVPPALPERLPSTGARTFEEHTQAALNKAGFGPDRLRQAAGYQPNPDWASLIGGSQQAAYNPYLGGSEAGIADVQRRLTGTQESQEAAFLEDRAFNRGQQPRMDAAANRGLAAYAANQRAQGLQQAALAKGSITPRVTFEQEAGMYAGNVRNLSRRIGEMEKESGAALKANHPLVSALAGEKAKYAQLIRNNQTVPEEALM